MGFHRLPDLKFRLGEQLLSAVIPLFKDACPNEICPGTGNDAAIGITKKGNIDFIFVFLGISFPDIGFVKAD